MHEKWVLCGNCGGRIKSREDLVVACVFLSVVPFHSRCWSTALKGCQSAIVGRQPINSVVWTVTAIILPILGVAGLMTGEPGRFFFFGATMLLPIVRLYSWFMYERRLDDQPQDRQV